MKETKIKVKILNKIYITVAMTMCSCLKLNIRKVDAIIYINSPTKKNTECPLETHFLDTISPHVAINPPTKAKIKAVHIFNF